MSVLSDQVIVITGVSEGIGRALSLAFVTQKPFRKKIEKIGDRKYP